MIVWVTKHDQYGNVIYRPSCDKAKAFAQIAKTTTLTAHSINMIKKLGYSIKVDQPEVSL